MSGEPARVTGMELLALGEALDDRGAEGRHRDAPASILDHCLANERLAADVVVHDGLVVVEEHDRVHFDRRRLTGQLIERAYDVLICLALFDGPRSDVPVVAGEHGCERAANLTPRDVGLP